MTRSCEQCQHMRNYLDLHRLSEKLIFCDSLWCCAVKPCTATLTSQFEFLVREHLGYEIHVDASCVSLNSARAISSLARDQSRRLLSDVAVTVCLGEKKINFIANLRFKISQLIDE